MKKRVAVLLTCVFPCIPVVASMALAKEHQQVAVEVVDSETSMRQFTYFIPGTPSRSTTNCNQNATIYDSGGSTATASGTENCTTTTTPGRPPSTELGQIAQDHVRAVIEGQHVMLWCQAGFRHCAHLRPGTYFGEIKGSAVWLDVYDLGHKKHRIKYRDAGGW